MENTSNKMSEDTSVENKQNLVNQSENNGSPFDIQKFKDKNPLIIDEPVKLTSFLEAVSKTHAWYHHYTSFEGLEAILETGTFKMTKGSSYKLNDLHEVNHKGEKETWERTFISCFNYSGEDEINYNDIKDNSFKCEENMAMWGLYGRPKTDAVRISFPQNVFLEIAKSFCKTEPKTDGFVIPNENIDIFTTDVFYVKCNDNDPDPEYQKHIDKKIIFNDCCRLFNFFQYDEFTGYVKNYAWNYEDEVRIIARIKPVNENDNNNDIKEITKKDAIFINIPEELLKTFIITIGPNFNKEAELDKLIHKYNLNHPKSFSGFEKMINFKSIYEVAKPSIDSLIIGLRSSCGNYNYNIQSLLDKFIEELKGC